MDLGVGSFVFSLGMTSALPLLRSKHRPPFLREAWSTTKKAAGVLLLGLARVAMVKGVDYPEHVSEYGVHWNFFFTLGLLPILGAAVGRLSPRVDFVAIALAVTGGQSTPLPCVQRRVLTLPLAVHQTFLSWSTLQFWTLTAARTGFLSMNKEGLVSLPGYLAIYLAGLSSGLYILPPDPYFYHVLHAVPKSTSAEAKERLLLKQRKMWLDKPGKLSQVLWSWSILWWAWFWFVNRLVGVAVSRRLANLPYVLWVTAFNVSFLSCYQLIELVGKSNLLGAGRPVDGPEAPAVFEAVNRNGLAVFLVVSRARRPCLLESVLTQLCCAGKPHDWRSEPLRREHVRARPACDLHLGGVPRRGVRDLVGAQASQTEDVSCS